MEGSGAVRISFVLLRLCSIGSLFFCYFPRACVLRCDPTVLSAGALDIAFNKVLLFITCLNLRRPLA